MSLFSGGEILASFFCCCCIRYFFSPNDITTPIPTLQPHRKKTLIEGKCASYENYAFHSVCVCMPASWYIPTALITRCHSALHRELHALLWQHSDKSTWSHL